MIAERQQRYPKGTYRVSVFHEEGGEAQFAVVNLYTHERMSFPSFWAMLRGIDRNMDQNHFPQYDFKLRSWGDHSTARGPRVRANRQLLAQPAEGSGQTVLLKLTHRQNATWQGTLQVAVNGAPKPFRSELELVRLMGRAVRL